MVPRPVSSLPLDPVGVRDRLTDISARLSLVRPRRVLAAAIVVQWASVTALALTVRHNGWIFYQGGDQLWMSTSGWALAHGVVVQPLVGYLWTALLAPVMAVGGPDLASSLPAIVIFDVVVLLPIAVACLFGIARLIGGRTYGYIALVAWLALPFAGILYTNTGYHQRYTELTLPQAFGLTAMADFPAMVATLVCMYFAARVVYDASDPLLDSLASGAAAGAAIGVKPATALVLAAPVLGFLVARRFRALAVFALALVPAIVALSFWKWRGYGYLPLLHAEGGVRVAAAAGGLVAVGAHDYLHFNWAHFTRELDLLREHFWSGRLLEWLVVAGLIGTARRSWRAFALVGGWLVPLVLVKTGYAYASIEDASLLRLLMPAFPAFVLLIAALIFLVPRRGRPGPPSDVPGRAPRRLRAAAVGAGLVLTTVVPAVAIAAAHPMTGQPRAAAIGRALVPVSVDVGLKARAAGRTVDLSWQPQKSAGGALFYHVYRSPGGSPAFTCAPGFPAEPCSFPGTDLGVTRDATFRVAAQPGHWEYRVGVTANWLNDTSQGDVYLLSRPASVTVR